MDLTFIVFQLVVLILSVIIHEVAHGFVAEKLGDSTARLAGRLTLNPLKHIDPFGSIFLPFLLMLTHSPVIFGWAKPVPYNPHNLHKDFKYGPLKVALAGPASNILIFLILGIIARVGFGFLSPNLIALFGFIGFLNIILAVFNLVPIPPLDGSKILPLIFPKIGMKLEQFGMMGIFFVFLFLYFFSQVIWVIATKIFIFVAGGEVYVTTFQLLIR